MERFERAEPSLDDIFVTVVTDGRRTGAAQADEGAAQADEGAAQADEGAAQTHSGAAQTHSGAAQAGRAPHNNE